MINVVKRNGQKEKLNYEKINQVLMWATENINNVSASDIAMNAELQIFDGITTTEIHEVLINSAVDLISEDYPNYQYVAARLRLYLLRKNIFNDYNNFDNLKVFIKENIKKGFYEQDLLKKYSNEELSYIEEKIIKHERDEKLTYAGLQQLIDKYLVSDRKTKEVFETPQLAYAIAAMSILKNYKKEDRLKRLKSLYDDYSSQTLNLPTPILAGVRTPENQYSSCVLINTDDNIDSIAASNHAIMRYISRKAGIGVKMGVRAIGSKIGNGRAVHTGIIPFIKTVETAVKSCSQGGIRGGAATVHYPFFHYEIEDIIVLKNNRGNDLTRARRLDHSIQFCKLFYERFIKNEDITLFSINEVTDLYEAFGKNNELFEKLYEKYERKTSIMKKKIKARDLMNLLIKERIETGRIYIQNIDNVNLNTPFEDKIEQSNLCVAPETKILTDKGYYPISELENEIVNVWNGEEWSETQVIKTGENQKLLEIKFSNGQTIECTPYHKFYIQKGYTKGTGKNKLQILEKRANELEKGDKIVKNKYPIIDFEEEFQDAYTQGFFSGDGCKYKGKNHIDLYGEKQLLKEYIKGHVVGNYNEEYDKIRVSINNNYEKFEVPLKYSIESRIKWFEGLCNSDGCLLLNGNTQAIQISSIHKNFLLEIQEMLQTLGVNSKVLFASDETMTLLPNSKGGKDYYKTKKAWRVNIGAGAIFKLSQLGFNPKRLNIHTTKPNRNAEQFVKVIEVNDLGRIDDTYCVNESKRNKVIFNGILTGNCQEINLPTTPFRSIDDPEGEIALCVLGAFNLGDFNLDNFDKLEERAYNILFTLDHVIENQEYPVKAAEKMLKRRSVGVGVTNFAYWLAKNNLKYSDSETLIYVDKLFEHIQYYLLKASVELAKEYGKCEWFHKTKYSKGILPIDRYNKNVDQLVKRNYDLDWESLRQDILKYGLRNSTLTAIMPSESSSVVSSATNGIEPIRSLITIKKSKSGAPLPVVVPEIKKLKNKYELAYTFDNKHMNNIVNVIQKWIDQGISVNHYYDKRQYENNDLPMSIVAKDILDFYKFGGKQLYYANSKDYKSDKLEDMITENNQEQITNSNHPMMDCGDACTI